MPIARKRVIKPTLYLSRFAAGQRLCVVCPAAQVPPKTLRELGFSEPSMVGERVLPTGVGPVSRRNAEGWCVVRRGQPKETAYRERWWLRKEWHGRDRVEVWDTVDVPYQRYPRDLVPPPSCELQMTRRGQETLVVSDLVEYTEQNLERLKHLINLFLELFGVCDVLDEGMTPPPASVVRRVNWEILPRGRYPWPKMQEHVRPLIERARKGRRPIIEQRLERVGQYEPDFMAIGRAGFRGYLVFGFEGRGLYILESMYYGNATYVFDREWETLSQLTKAEILSSSYQRDRIVHLKSWEGQFAALMASGSR